MAEPPTDSVVVERAHEGIGLVAYMIQHSDGQVQLVSWPEGSIRVRGASWDEIWPMFLQRLHPLQGS